MMDSDLSILVRGIGKRYKIGAAQQRTDINRQTDALLDSAQTLTSLLLQQRAPSSNINAASQLTMLTQRIDKSANAFLSFQGVRPEAVFTLGKDLSTFNDLTKEQVNKKMGGLGK